VGPAPQCEILFGGSPNVKMDELMDTVETVEIVEGVRVRLTGVESCAGVAVAVAEVVGEEGDDGVSDSDGRKIERGDVRGVKTSVRGVGLVNKLAEGCETLGRMNDVSKLISGPSGTPFEVVLGGARVGDSCDALDSSAH
jgi:hypothetical protein